MNLLHQFDFHNPVHVGALVGVVLLLMGLMGWVFRKRRLPAIEVERRRRLWLVRHGRLIDGMVLDLTEIAPEVSGLEALSQYLLYRYQIAGVIYESSQEVTHLNGYIDIQNCRIDLPASIKYDPHNPANSIVVAENWSGLHEGRHVVRTVENQGLGISG
jgi:hypothetical protein